MKIISYEAHNVLGVKDIRFDMEGRHLFLVGGGNGQGKTSALTALVMTLCGKSGMKDYPQIALRDGQRKGKVTIELTGSTALHEDVGLTAELSLRRKASGVVVEEFRLLDSTGEEAPEPRKTLQRLFQLKAFDPLEFERMKPKEKASCVQQMLGLDLSKYDKDYQSVFEERTAVGREGKKLAAQLDSATKHKDAPKEEVKVSDVLASIEEVREGVIERERLDATAKSLVQINDKCVDSLRELEAEVASLKKEIKERATEIDRQEKQLSEIPDRTGELLGLKEKLETSEDTNRKVRENQSYDKLAKEVKASRGQWQTLTDRLKEIAEERAEEVANADWPIEGMELQEDGLIWSGLPFEQASKSQRIIASALIGMGMNPELRLMVIEHGSDLDVDTLNGLDAILKERDFQCVVELVTRSKEDEERCAVVIADGEVVGAELPDTEEEED